MVHAIAELRKSLNDVPKYRIVTVSKGDQPFPNNAYLLAEIAKETRFPDSPSQNVVALEGKWKNKFSSALCTRPIIFNLDGKERRGNCEFRFSAAEKYVCRADV